MIDASILNGDDMGVPSDAPPDADITAPMLASSVPPSGAIDVAISSTISVVFSEPVQNCDASTFLVSAGGSGVSGIVTEIAPLDGTTYQFSPETPFPPNETISVILNDPIRDLSGNQLSSTAFSFETGS